MAHPLRVALTLGVLITPPFCVNVGANQDHSYATTQCGPVPSGTILPATLNRSVSSKKTKAGQAISARVAQDVPLPDGCKIPAGAKLIGTVTSVEQASATGGAKISLRFNQLRVREREYSIITNLRAIAGPVDVRFAQTPETSPGFGTPSPWVTTQQIGGDEVYGVDGPVTDRENNHVGKGVYGGVLVHVRARPGSECRGPLDQEDRLQALWVFSSDACGVYGIDHVSIAHAGRTDPVGVITLVVKDHKHTLLVRSGTGMLLRAD